MVEKQARGSVRLLLSMKYIIRYSLDHRYTELGYGDFLMDTLQSKHKLYGKTRNIW